MRAQTVNNLRDHMLIRGGQFCERDALIAHAEGWLLAYWYRDDGTEVNEIQRLDAFEPWPKFDSDADARAYVAMRAAGGSALHLRALAACTVAP